MQIIKNFKKEILSKSRVEALSDGVFAIIVTLLILDIRLPAVDIKNNAELFSAIKSTAPHIISWLISFWIVAVYWINHHNIFHLAKKIDYVFVWLNFAFLLVISFVPFPTGILGEYWDYPVAITFLVINLVLCAIFITLIWYYTTRYLSDEKKFNIRFLLMTSVVGFALYALVIIFSWINIYISYLFFFAVPIYFMIPWDNN